MTVAAFAVIPTDPIFGYTMKVDPINLPAPLSNNFLVVGFATTYFTNNVGTLFFGLLQFPILVVVAFLLKPITSKPAMFRRIQIERNIYWSATIQNLSDSFTIIATCAMI
jgi:hypothetical protein